MLEEATRSLEDPSGKSLYDAWKATVDRGKRVTMKTYSRWFTSIATLICVFFLAACQGKPQATPTATATLSVQVAPANSPQILHQSPIQGQRLDLSPTIQITFDRAMNQTRTSAAWSFVDESNQPVSGTVTWLNDRTLQFKPGQALLPAKTYTAILSTGAAGTDGISLTNDLRIEFKTTDALVVGQVFPSDATDNVAIKSAITVIFNKPVVPLMSLEDQANLPARSRSLQPWPGAGIGSVPRCMSTSRQRA